MDAEARRDRILEALREAASPVSASRLAGELGVSRQVIVGDVALLRAQGCDILATARGYLMAPIVAGSRYLGKLPCQHTMEQTEQELSAIVELGGEVINVTVEHFLYGEITGQLNIVSPGDVADFMRRVKNNEARLLSELTGGIHLHTVACRDKAAFDAIWEELSRLDILYRSSE